MPDLVVSGLVVPAAVSTDAPFDVTYVIGNRGRADAAGTWKQRLFLSRDDQVGGDDVLLGTFDFSGTIPAGSDVGRTVSVRAPGKTGDYRVIVIDDVGGDVDEFDESNNVAISGPISVEADYTATVGTDVQTAAAGTPVVMTGKAVKVGTSNPAPLRPVSVRLRVRGTERVITAMTDANGNFTATFTPLASEGGNYTIGATHPGVSAFAAQDQFTLVGIAAEPAQAAHKLIEAAAAVQGQVLLRNLSDVGLTGLSARVVSKPGNVSVALTLGGGSPDPALAGSGTLPLTYALSAADASVTDGVVLLRVTSDEGASVDVPINVTVEALRPRLVAEPGSLAAGMVRGGQRAVEFQVTNAGGAPTGTVAVALPAAPWLSLATAAEIPSLAPGESTKVTLLLTPAADLPLSEYTGRISLRAAGGGPGAGVALDVPFTFRAVSDATGNLGVTVIDEQFYFTEGAPRLADADVILRDAVDGEEVARGRTDAAGRASFAALREGHYTLEVRADDHDGYRNSIFVAAAESNQEEVFLSEQTVEYVWTVEETEVADRTTIRVETVFETNVPQPVVTFENAVIDLADLTTVGQSMQVDIKITNHGLIAAEDVTLRYDSHPLYAITPLIGDIGVLPAGTSVTVPVIARRIADFTPLGGAALAATLSSSADAPAGGRPPIPCAISGTGSYRINCGKYKPERIADLPVPNVQGDCPPGKPADPAPPPRPPSSEDGGDGGPGGVIESRAVKIQLPDLCKLCDVQIGERDVSEYVEPFLVVAETAANVYLKQFLTTLDLAVVARAEVRTCCEGLFGFGLEFEAEAAITGTLNVGPSKSFDVNYSSGGVTFAGSVAAALQISPTITVSANILSGCNLSNPEVTLGGSIGFSINAGVTGQLKASSAAGEEVAEAKGGLFGDMTYSFELRDGEIVPCFTSSGIYLQASASAFGETVSLFDDPSTEEVEERKYLVPPATCETGGDTAPAVAEAQAASALAYQEARQEVTAELAARGIVPEAAAGDPGVCAQVRLAVDQDAVVTRTAFRAGLELTNNSPGSPLEDAGVKVRVYDTGGNDVTNLFSIGTPQLGGLTAADGTGTLSPATRGTAAWLILPTDAAAPDGPREYRVGGTLTYTLDGKKFTIPLEPVSITVRPDAALDLKYFQQRDALGDDPFTDDRVEPSVPFTLAVMVRNRGAGAARDLRITSAEPRIIENEKGLLANFDIIGTEVAGQSLTPSLTANFGNVDAGEIQIGRFLLTSSLQGHFTEYEATFEHIDGRGDPRLSLIKNVEIHELIHTVTAGGASDDGKPDFLANDLPDAADLPDALHLSDGSVVGVSPAANAMFDGVPTAADPVVGLTADTDAGWSYLKARDPGDGRWRLDKVVRSDGTELAADNYWQTDRTFVGGGERPVYEDNLHLVDKDSTGSYTLHFTPLDQTAPTVDIVDVTPDPRAGPIDSIRVVFSEPVKGFRPSHLSLTRDGGPQLLTGNESLSTADGGTTWVLGGLADRTAASGNYILTLAAPGSEVTDLANNPLAAGASEAFAVTVPPPPRITAWYSAASHGRGVGEAKLAVPDNGTFSESRAGGIRTLLVEFSSAIDPASFTPAAVAVAGTSGRGGSADLTGVTVSTSLRPGNTVGVITFGRSLPDFSKYLVRVNSITGSTGAPVEGDTDRVLTALAGDATGDRRVNNTDAGAVKSIRGTDPIRASVTNQVRADVTRDGRVNNTDVGAVTSVRGRDARYIPDPTVSRNAAALARGLAPASRSDPRPPGTLPGRVFSERLISASKVTALVGPFSRATDQILGS